MVCPYRGLSQFNEQDAEFFFGRERFIFGEEQSKTGLLKAVHTQPLVAVIGSSGSGKSSVIAAGLIPQLRLEGNWLIDIFRPTSKPFQKLASALIQWLEPNLSNTGQSIEAGKITKSIIQGHLTLSQVVSDILRINSGKRLLLVIDQFEEIYTLCSSEKQYQFINLLLDAINVGNLALVLALRADFYGYVLSHRPFRDALQRFTPQLLSSMNRKELQSCIEKPLEKSGVSLEAELTQRILDDVGEEPGNLPLLEFALFELWNNQQNGKLTHSIYDKIGGVKKAIANHAEKVYGQLNEIQQKQAQYIFTQLVCPGRGTEDTRRLATRSEIGVENWDLVNHLANYREYSTDYQARLLVTGWDEGKNENTIEIIHEALILEWKRLQAWMTEDRKFRTWQESLRFLIQSWENSGRDKNALLRGLLLVEAKTWLKQRALNISAPEKEFIQKSRQRERLVKYRAAIFGSIVIAFLVLAQRQFEELLFQKRFFDAFFGVPTSSDLIHLLPQALEKADRHVNDKKIDTAIELYKDTLTVAENFIKTVPVEDKELNNEYIKEIIYIQKNIEKSLAKVVKNYYIDIELKPDLNSPPFGKRKGSIKDVRQFENQYM
ncbi:MAG: hypothetical protein F6K09_03205 [Merismopedia sp. SIO2A8]|nr:hypothetical protein [Merismopedia sp. SIO2A8]